MLLQISSVERHDLTLWLAELEWEDKMQMSRLENWILGHEVEVAGQQKRQRRKSKTGMNMPPSFAR